MKRQSEMTITGGICVSNIFVLAQGFGCIRIGVPGSVEHPQHVGELVS